MTTGNEESEIKTMKLYSDVERIDNELRERGKADGPLRQEDLSDIDTMHYEGDAAIQAGIDAIGVDKSSMVVLDVGSGFGGPARYIANATQCSVFALELQTDVHEKAAELTERCGLGNLVKHVHGNFLDYDLHGLGGGLGSFDGIVSWLVFLHIPEKKRLFQNCAAMLSSGGTLFAEDFYKIGTFADNEVISLQNDIYCRDLPTKEEYIEAVESSGFNSVNFVDKTEDWTSFVSERLDSFVSNRTEVERIHGRPTFERLLHFYNAMVKLFRGGHLGGVRLSARRQ